MRTLSLADPTADIACTLPINDARDRLAELKALIGDDLQAVATVDGRLHITIGRSGRDDLDAIVATWANEEKACCAFLGFSIESSPQAVTLEIVAPSGAELTLDGIEWVVRAAADMSSNA